MEEFRLGDVGFIFGGREGEDGRGVEDCGGWEGGGGEHSAAFGSLVSFVIVGFCFGRRIRVVVVY